MRVLLTGNQGYIGCIMEEMFLNRGYDVVGYDMGFFRGKDFVPQKPEVIKNRGKNQILKDTRDISPDDLKGIDAIVHLAALSNDPVSALDPELTNEINFKASLRMAQIAKEQGVKKFLYSSSCIIYGIDMLGDILDESARFNPTTAYAHSKVDSEREIKKLATQEFAPVFMRNATAYGVSPRMRFDLVTNNLSAWAYLIDQVKIMGDGKPWRPVVHIRDLSRAFMTVLEAPMDRVNNQSFNVGNNDDNYTIRELADKVAIEFPKAQVITLGETKDNRSYRVNFDKIMKTLDFTPEWCVERGLKELHETFDSVHLTKEMFEDEYFNTVLRMKNLLARGEITKELRYP